MILHCCTTRFESPNIFKRVAPQALAILMPFNRASYSASLFEACKKLIRSTYFSLSFAVILVLLQLQLLQFSWIRRNTLSKRSTNQVVLCSVILTSAVKSSKTCDLMAFLFLYVMSKREILIPHKETHHVASRLFNIFDSGASLTTIIG
jgi:hypothetical protein